MSIAMRSFSGVKTPIRRVRADGTLRTLLVICCLIAAPSLVLMFFLSGWVLYVFASVLAVNLAVPAIAYYASPTARGQLFEDDDTASRSDIP